MADNLEFVSRTVEHIKYFEKGGLTKPGQVGDPDHCQTSPRDTTRACPYCATTLLQTVVVEWDVDAGDGPAASGPRKIGGGKSLYDQLQAQRDAAGGGEAGEAARVPTQGLLPARLDDEDAAFLNAHVSDARRRDDNARTQAEADRAAFELAVAASRAAVTAGTAPTPAGGLSRGAAGGAPKPGAALGAALGAARAGPESSVGLAAALPQRPQPQPALLPQRAPLPQPQSPHPAASAADGAGESAAAHGSHEPAATRKHARAPPVADVANGMATGDVRAPGAAPPAAKRRMPPPPDFGGAAGSTRAGAGRLAAAAEHGALGAPPPHLPLPSGLGLDYESD